MRSYSRRELYALGESLGDSVTKKKLLGGGYVCGGGGSSGGGGGSAPANQNYTTSNIAPWAQPGVESLISSAMQNIYPNMTTNADGSISLGAQKGYVPFNASGTDAATQQAMQSGQSMVAPSTALQNQSYAQAGNLQTPAQIADASNMAQQAGLQSLNAQYNPLTAGYNQVQGAQAGIAQLGQSPQAQAAMANSAQLNPASTIQGSQFQGPQNVNAQQVSSGPSFTQQGMAQQYMNPYIQASLNPQLQLLNQQYGQQAAQEQAGATRAGAFGGSREALMSGLNQQNQMLAQNQLVSNAYNQAYQNAQNQYNTEAAAQLQANLANQQAGLQAGLANQNVGYNTALQNAQMNQQANLANQAALNQYGLQQGQFNQAANLANQQAQMQANLANQQYGSQYGLANLQAMNQGQQYNASNAQQAALANQQAALQAQQANINQQQFGANYRMQGLNQANQAASNLGNLGGQQFATQQGIIGLQNQLGTQQQQNLQNALNYAANQYAQMQNAPLNQLGMVESLYTGAPQNMTQLQYQAPPSMISQLGGLGMTGLGAYGLYNNATKKKGGIIKYNAGGIVSLGLDKAMRSKA